MTPVLAVSIGDPAGVGPELLAEAWSMRAARDLPAFAAIGSLSVLMAAAHRRGLDMAVRAVSDLEQAAAMTDALPVIDLGEVPYTPGQPDAAGARLALGSLELACRLAITGKAGGIVTGPIAKSRLAEVGFDFPGQTEFVAAACNVPADNAVMMLAGPSLRTVPLTVHVALSAVPGMISADLIVNKARIVARALADDFGITAPRLAISALNPHAGEDGRMGDEDHAIIAPAIARLAAEGTGATGPHPADALFAPHNRANFDAALCMYHDQALIPIKALDFDQGVNVTLGLPVVRTSPDHGTAFAIAGTGRADPGAMIAAIHMAGQCAARRQAACHG